LPNCRDARVLAPERGVGRLLFHVLEETLSGLKPDPLKARAERHVNFRLRSFLDLHAFKPSGVTGQDLGARDFLDRQAVSRHQPECGFKAGRYRRPG
jgi:hypothetical protein